MRRRSFALLLPGFISLATLQAQPLVDADATRGNNGSSSDDAFTSLQVAFSFHNNATDVFPTLQKSTSLLSGSWENMVENVDYSDQTIRTIDLLTPDNAEGLIFFRQSFTQTP